tara:strand:+ start:89 stop:352 length:264 start_codon:yes stop_codon:yes gene_type:complete
MSKNKDLGTVIDYNKDNSRTVLKTDYVVDSIVDQFIDRASFGRQKYGVGMEREDLSILEWIEHAKQEHMDAILYLEKLKVILGGRQK